MDLDYIQKYTFQSGGSASGGFPLSDSSILTTSLTYQTGGASFALAIPGGLVYLPTLQENYLSNDIETDPWKIEVREDFDSLLNIVSCREHGKNKTAKKKKGNGKGNGK
jgi:hypothetical protein